MRWQGYTRYTGAYHAVEEAARGLPSGRSPGCLVLTLEGRLIRAPRFNGRPANRRLDQPDRGRIVAELVDQRPPKLHAGRREREERAEIGVARVRVVVLTGAGADDREAGPKRGVEPGAGVAAVAEGPATRRSKLGLARVSHPKRDVRPPCPKLAPAHRLVSEPPQLGVFALPHRSSQWLGRVAVDLLERHVGLQEGPQLASEKIWG